MRNCHLNPTLMARKKPVCNELEGVYNTNLTAHCLFPTLENRDKGTNHANTILGQLNTVSLIIKCQGLCVQHPVFHLVEGHT